MLYIVVDTTDGKYEGIRIEINEIPLVGDIFLLKDIEVKIKEVVLSKNTLELISDNYIIVLEKINEEE